LNRKEAVSLIREIDVECKNIRGTSIILLEPSESNLLSKGYQVHVKMKATPTRLQCLRVIAGEYGCAVNVGEDNWSVVIYRPPGKGKPETETGLM